MVVLKPVSGERERDFPELEDMNILPLSLSLSLSLSLGVSQHCLWEMLGLLFKSESVSS